MAALQAVLTPRTLQKGEMFLREGQVCATVAFIEQGSARLYYAADGREISKEFLFENALLGSFASFFARQPSLVNVAALEETALLEMHYPDVQQLCAEHPAWQRLALLLIQDQVVRAERREASLLRDAPEQRFRNLIEEHPKVFKRVPLQYIASYLGITPETLSRYRSKLKP